MNKKTIIECCGIYGASEIDISPELVSAHRAPMFFHWEKSILTSYWSTLHHPGEKLRCSFWCTWVPNRGTHPLVPPSKSQSLNHDNQSLKPKKMHLPSALPRFTPFHPILPQIACIFARFLIARPFHFGRSFQSASIFQLSC